MIQSKPATARLIPVTVLLTSRGFASPPHILILTSHLPPQVTAPAFQPPSAIPNKAPIVSFLLSL